MATPAKDERTRRLMIREMVLENFKSYAGEQHVGPFHKSFSSVVGPNGSGKSNVIDAMLFVFGRRAKQLRFNKVSELIHKSSDYQNLQMAKVSVYFQEIYDLEGEAFEVIPGTDFFVSRTATADNKSEYYVNNRKVNVSEVTSLLKGKGIDLDNNRFLILQGEVEQISMMKPKAENEHDTGLLEYLEDIIGTDKYKTPIAEESKKLEELNDKRQSMIARVKVVEKEKDALEQKKNAAELYLNKQAEMTKLKVVGHSIYARDAQANIDKADSELQKVQSKLAHEQEKSKEFTAKLAVVEKEFKTKEKEYDTLNTKVEKLEEEFKELERRDVKNQEDLKNLKGRVKKADVKIASHTQAMEKAEREAAETEMEVPVLRKKVAELTAQQEEQERVLEQLKEGTKGEVVQLREQKNKISAELAPWEKKKSEVTSRITVAKGERDALFSKVDKAKRQLDRQSAEAAGARQVAAEKQGQIAEIEAEIRKHRQQIIDFQQQGEASKAQEASLDGILREKSERAHMLKSDLNSQQKTSEVVKVIMAAVERGEMSGVYGRLGDLGAVDAKYDVAVSSASSALDNIVVETVTDAQRGVEVLRRDGRYSATFLILDKQRNLEAKARQQVRAPEDTHRLYDLIKVKDDKLRCAFYYAFADTLVAKDLTQASRIAYHPNSQFRRVVTLEGQLVAESGAMTGGGGRPRGGKIALGNSAPKTNIDVRAITHELQKLERELDDLNRVLAAARDASAMAAQGLKNAERTLVQLESSLRKTRVDIDSELQKATVIEEQLAALSKAAQMDAADAGRIAELDNDVAGAEGELSRLKAQTATLDKQLDEVVRKLNNPGGEPMRKQTARVEALKKEVSTLEAEITKKTVAVKSSAKTMERIKKDMEKETKDKQKFLADIEELQREIQTMEETAEKMLVHIKKMQDARKEKKEEVDKAKTERDEMREKASTVRSVEENLKSTLDMLGRRKREEATKLKDLTKTVDKEQAEYMRITGGEAYIVTEEDLHQTPEDVFFNATFISEELQKMDPDMNSIEEYKTKEADYNTRVGELDVVTKERDESRKTYESLRKRRLDEFMAGFTTISLKLKEMYQMITLGGDAELELVDSLDPFSEGIVFSVRPPKKSWKNISNLSGGEKTLSSLSLVFALHHYKPTPLYVMDEIDAALDFKNVSIVGHYIKERTRNAQFVIISLRNNMFELADRLVGIYKTNNTTKTVAINPSEFVVGCKPGGTPAPTPLQPKQTNIAS